MFKRIIATCAMLIMLGSVASAESKPFPDLALKGELTAEHSELLGLSGKTSPYKLSSIKAQYVVIEVFSMYCPLCQHDAPAINELNDILMSEEYRDKAVLIGIGAGNSQFEVDFYRKKYEIFFPLFEDIEFINHKDLGGPGTPWFAVVKPHGPNGPEVLWMQEGAIRDKDEFFKTVLSYLK